MNRSEADLAHSEKPRCAPVIRARMAFDQIHETHSALVFHNAKGLGVADANVDDVRQKVFLVLYRRFSIVSRIQRLDNGASAQLVG
jgi:hypothetical protein